MERIWTSDDEIFFVWMFWEMGVTSKQLAVLSANGVDVRADGRHLATVAVLSVYGRHLATEAVSSVYGRHLATVATLSDQCSQQKLC